MNLICLLCRLLMLLMLLVLFAPTVWGQEQLLQQRWVQVTSANFILVSQLPARQTAHYANTLETWRQLAANTISGAASYPTARIPQYVYLFEDAATYQLFTLATETGFFSPTPRANYMAIVADDETSSAIAFHHYVHFLVRNFSDLRLSRWYEEGLAGYISRLRIDGNEGEFERYTAEDHEQMAALSETFSMERLLFREEALASPRVIQIANLKSESLLYYLLHAHEEEGFPDRRAHLQRYLALLLEGRNHRFAYDQAFEVTPAQLDAEFHYYLSSSRRPGGTINTASLSVAEEPASTALDPGALAVLLAELALNSGRFDNAQIFFQAAMDSGQEIARSYSGLGDALRMQEMEGIDQSVSRYFEQAAELAPADPNILLDYGEYWESELLDCDKIWPAVQRSAIVADIREHFVRVVELAPDSPEANLAMGQVHLLAELDWQSGQYYQRRAFELLPADTFVLEQSVKYAIEAQEYQEAERLISELAQPLHFWGEPDWVTDLRERLLHKRNGTTYDACANN